MLNESRRQFLKTVVIGGVSVCFAPLVNAMQKKPKGLYTAGNHWATDKGQARFRLDAIQKVMGEKVYGRDLRAKDMQDWPDEQYHGYVVCATDVNRTFLGLDLTFLEIAPAIVILAEDLEQHQIKLPSFHGHSMLVKKGDSAHFIGHPVAILLFADFARYNMAKSRLDFNQQLVRYGNKVTPYTRDPYATWRVIRVSEDRTEGKDAFSPFQDGLFFPAYQLRQPKWPTAKNRAGTLSERGMYYADAIEKDIISDKYHIVEKNFQTQIIEPMMLEPEAANAWYDQAAKTLHMVQTAQDPTDFAEMAVAMAKASTDWADINRIILYTGFIGGGFGAKDHSVFPYYTVAAGMFTKGKPVRIANDRYQQFQSGLKRHPFTIKNKLAIDKKSLKIMALTSKLQVDGGGRENFSASVASAGMSAMQGVYYVPNSDLQANAYFSRNVNSGSMRGYGSTQCMPIIDLMLDQAASELQVDSFELKRKNLLKTGDLNTQGAQISGEIRYREMLDKAEKNPIWQNRKKNKKAYEKMHPDMLFGVGYSLLAKNYGTGNVGPNAAVNISEEGKINVEIEYIEMGSGAQTSQGLLAHRYFGRAADEVRLGVIDTWKALQLYETDNPYTISQQKQDKQAKDPLWTPVKLMASSASDSATFQSEVTKEACAIVLEHGILPAARQLWGLDATADITAANWQSGSLVLSGKSPLSLTKLAKTAHEKGFITGAVTHTVNRWAWTTAEFTIEGKTSVHSLDALAVRYGTGATAKKKKQMDSDGYHLIKRNWVNYPSTKYNAAMVTYYAPCDCLVELAINKYSGAVTILKTHTVLDSGPPIFKPILEGQIQGGLVMGLGHVLHEYLPLFEAGAGNGSWNLNRYHVPKATDVNIWDMQLEILPSPDKKARAKGIGEVVMLPVISAVQNAIYHATGARFSATPITAEQIKKKINL